ncbi:MAG: extracellular solute-binding protein [Solirubrobacterales bacterium]|nr:extracellular solute-binding protein [Solirubrobacterales bacterium]
MRRSRAWRWVTWLGLGAVMTLVVAALAACGGDDDESEAPATPGEASGSLRVVSNWTGAEGDAFAAVLDGFQEANPGVEIESEEIPFDQTQAQLAQQFAAGDPPDVSVALPGIVRQLAEQDQLMDLDDLWDEWIDDGSYTQALRDVAQAGVEGPTSSIYFKGNVNALIWYRTDELEALGGEVPETWDEFIDLLDRAAEEGIRPVAVGGADEWPLTQWTDSIILRVAGADAFNQLARGEIGWDDPRIVDSFEVFADLISNYFPPDALSASFVDETCSWADGKAAFTNQGAFVNLVAPAECDKSLQPGRDFTFFEMPKYDESAPDARFVSGDLFIGAKESENAEAAKALLAYLGSAEAQEIWAKRGGYIAPNAKVPPGAYPDVNDRKAAELWPKSDEVEAGYDLDDWIGGRVQSEYRGALQQFVREPDVDAFIAKMTEVDTRSSEG